MLGSCRARNSKGPSPVQNEITAMAMHPHDETLFVSGDYTGSIMFWDVSSPDPIAVRGSGEQGAHEA
jgi:WD40 repeat protein